ncbi:hypothetical protein EVAR_31705_1 [Eumeta japonica]|uniref:Uncharacterized protein n=1 Tax=Eumeta variegata TaxID=151549 RepID=A0A4C1VUB2_EUMVA|nr:hypothetical protein EVAR_31705_1 [Eumeta japonica]
MWMMPTFWRGYKRDLYDSDLTKPKDNHLSDKLGDRLEKIENATKIRSESKTGTDFKNGLRQKRVHTPAHIPVTLLTLIPTVGSAYNRDALDSIAVAGCGASGAVTAGAKRRVEAPNLFIKINERQGCVGRVRLPPPSVFIYRVADSP